VPLCFFDCGAQFRVLFLESTELRRATELVPSAPCAMTLILLTTICFFGCGFLLYVLVQWMRETKRKPASPPAIGNEADQLGEKKRLRVVKSRRTLGKTDRFTLRSGRSGCGDAVESMRRRRLFDRVGKLRSKSANSKPKVSACAAAADQGIKPQVYIIRSQETGKHRGNPHEIQRMAVLKMKAKTSNSGVCCACCERRAHAQIVSSFGLPKK
jgi:hypothetical protein